MTSSPTPSPLTPEAARVLAGWAGLTATPDLAAVLQAFHDRVQRLYAMDVEAVEFDFLRPMD
jgi:hypothetical protein